MKDYLYLMLDIYQCNRNSCLQIRLYLFTCRTINIAQCLNGLAGPVCMGGPPVLSALWFPIHERTTATAFQTVFNYLGVGLSFIIGN